MPAFYDLCLCCFWVFKSVFVCFDVFWSFLLVLCCCFLQVVVLCCVVSVWFRLFLCVVMCFWSFLLVWCCVLMCLCVLCVVFVCFRLFLYVLMRCWLSGNSCMMFLLCVCVFLCCVCVFQKCLFCVCCVLFVDLCGASSCNRAFPATAGNAFTHMVWAMQLKYAISGCGHTLHILWCDVLWFSGCGQKYMHIFVCISGYSQKSHDIAPTPFNFWPQPEITHFSCIAHTMFVNAFLAVAGHALCLTNSHHANPRNQHTKNTQTLWNTQKQHKTTHKNMRHTSKN